MTRFIALVALIFPLVASAQDASFCTREAAVFGIASDYRDNNQSPQEAFRQMHSPAKASYGFPDDVVKDIINTVYFDPEASKVPHERMMNQVLGDCMRPPKTFKPLD